MTTLEHYDCQKPHRLGKTGRTKHFATCNVAPGHDSGTTLRCRPCHKGYYRKHYVSDERRAKIAEGYRRAPNHPHYDCGLPRSGHPIVQGMGSGHRAGCQVAEGHTAGLSAGNGCQACGKRNKRRHLLSKTYGLTVEDYDALLEFQGGVCAICHELSNEKTAATSRELPLFIDHDHVSGKIRGLLCSTCNFAIGMFQDDPERIKRAAKYVIEGAERTG